LLVCHLKLQSGLAGRIGHGRHATVVQKATAIEDDSRDAGGLGPLRDQSPDCRGCIFVPGVCE
jgi:hypothetical protein